MTLEQMEAMLSPEPKIDLAEAVEMIRVNLREPALLPLDYAQSANLSLAECLKTKTCPVCGHFMKAEVDLAYQAVTTYWCSKNNSHVFESDAETGTIDRVPW
jgi:hypothetical protein